MASNKSNNAAPHSKTDDAPAQAVTADSTQQPDASSHQASAASGGSPAAKSGGESTAAKAANGGGSAGGGAASSAGTEDDDDLLPATEMPRTMSSYSFPKFGGPVIRLGNYRCVTAVRYHHQLYQVGDQVMHSQATSSSSSSSTNASARTGRIVMVYLQGGIEQGEQRHVQALVLDSGKTVPHALSFTKLSAPVNVPMTPEEAAAVKAAGEKWHADHAHAAERNLPQQSREKRKRKTGEEAKPSSPTLPNKRPSRGRQTKLENDDDDVAPSDTTSTSGAAPTAPLPMATRRSTCTHPHGAIGNDVPHDTTNPARWSSPGYSPAASSWSGVVSSATAHMPLLNAYAAPFAGGAPRSSSNNSNLDALISRTQNDLALLQQAREFEQRLAAAQQQHAADQNLIQHLMVDAAQHHGGQGGAGSGPPYLYSR